MIDKRKAQMVKSITEAYKGAESAQKEIDSLLKYLDYHLLALHKALQAKNTDQLAFHTYKAEAIRKRLMQLEYFAMPELEKDPEVSGS